MSFNQITPPTNKALDTATVKKHLRVEHTEDDTYIEGLIDAVTLYLEKQARRQLITATFQLRLDSFPNEIRFPRAKLQSVDSVAYIDPNGQPQTLDPSFYEIDVNAEPGIMRLAHDQKWPEVRNHPGVITINYKGGYGDDPADIPSHVRSALMLHITTLYDNRASVTMDEIPRRIPNSYEALVSTIRVHYGDETF